MPKTLFAIFLLLLLSISAKKTNLSPRKHKKTEIEKEQTELFAAVQNELQNELGEVKKKIKKEYELMNTVAQKLGKLEQIHTTALEFEQLVIRTEKNLKKEENEEKAEKLEKTKQFAEKAVREAEKARNAVQKLIETINKELDKLLGQADNVFHKAHVTQAQKNINLATQEFNKIFRFETD